MHGGLWTKIAKTTPCKVRRARDKGIIAPLQHGQEKKKEP
jgi:hypothetical protein